MSDAIGQVDPGSALARGSARPRGSGRRATPRSRRLPDVGTAIALIIIALLAVATIAPGLLTPHDPIEGDVLATLQAPSGEHLFGTDRLGRDILARTVYGARYSLAIGLGAAALSVVCGVLLGLLAGLRSQVLDETVSRLFDVISSFPGVLLALLVVTFFGAGLTNIAIAVGISGIPKFGRVVRAQTRLVREADYVVQARIYGRGPLAVFFAHLLPNVLTAVPVVATVSIGTTILAVSGLSFLGLGPQPPTPEWGVMLAESRDVLRVAWWPGFFPGAAITVTVIAFTVLGNALQKRFERRSS